MRLHYFGFWILLWHFSSTFIFLFVQSQTNEKIVFDRILGDASAGVDQRRGEGDANELLKHDLLRGVPPELRIRFEYCDTSISLFFPF